MIDDKVHCMLKAKEYEYDYWDGDRRINYGGYKYIKNRWNEVIHNLYKNNLAELNCKFLLEAPENIKDKIHAEVCISIVFKLTDPKMTPDEVKKTILISFTHPHLCNTSYIYIYPPKGVWFMHRIIKFCN